MPYTPHPHHRNAAYSAQKSQWLIGPNDEQESYQVAITRGWSFENFFWGLYLINAVPTALGVSPTPDRHNLHIAKFVGDESGNWHGYPVAHWLSPFDKPSTNVLEAWVESGFIGRAKMGKIKRGKRCGL